MAYPLVKQLQHRYTGNLRFVFTTGCTRTRTTGHPTAPPACRLACGLRWVWTSRRSLPPRRHADIATHFRRDFMGGVRSGVNGTPSFYVNGYLYQRDFDALVHGIGRVIARRR